jgi:hypothetical protein
MSKTIRALDALQSARSAQAQLNVQDAKTTLALTLQKTIHATLQFRIVQSNHFQIVKNVLRASTLLGHLIAPHASQDAKTVKDEALA